MTRYLTALLALVIVPLADLQAVEQPAVSGDTDEAELQSSQQPEDVAPVVSKVEVPPVEQPVETEVVADPVVEEPVEDVVSGDTEQVELQAVEEHVEAVVEEVVEKAIVDEVEPIVEEVEATVEEVEAIVETVQELVEEVEAKEDSVSCDANIPPVVDAVDCDAAKVDAPSVDKADKAVIVDADKGMFTTILKFLHLI